MSTPNNDSPATQPWAEAAARELLLEASGTVEASTAESDVSDARLAYRPALLTRIRSHLSAMQSPAKEGDSPQ